MFISLVSAEETLAVMVTAMAAGAATAVMAAGAVMAAAMAVTAAAMLFHLLSLQVLHLVAFSGNKETDLCEWKSVIKGIGIMLIPFSCRIGGADCSF